MAGKHGQVAALRGNYATRVASAPVAAVDALATALELRDCETGGHAERVTELALALARSVAPSLAAAPELAWGFRLHDVGKIGLPDALLRKAGPLDADERMLVEDHPLLGARIIEPLAFLRDLARDVVLAHHERWDGGGYPSGLRATSIPLGARIFAVVDAFDAITSDRPYRAAAAADDAVAEIEAGAGTQFDPRVAAAFVALAPRLRDPRFGVSSQRPRYERSPRG